MLGSSDCEEELTRPWQLVTSRRKRRIGQSDEAAVRRLQETLRGVPWRAAMATEEPPPEPPAFLRGSPPPEPPAEPPQQLKRLLPTSKVKSKTKRRRWRATPSSEEEAAPASPEVDLVLRTAEEAAELRRRRGQEPESESSEEQVYDDMTERPDVALILKEYGDMRRSVVLKSGLAYSYYPAPRRTRPISELASRRAKVRRGWRRPSSVFTKKATSSSMEKGCQRRQRQEL